MKVDESLIGNLIPVEVKPGEPGHSFQVSQALVGYLRLIEM
jgi:hypothetical protein